MFAVLISKIPMFFAAIQPGTSCTLPGTDKNTFFGLPHWWQYMSGVADGAGGCTPKFVFPDGIFQIGLAAINIMLHIAGFVAVIAIIVAGISYLFATGNPEKVTSSRKGIQNALIGLSIAMVAAQIVTFIGNRLG